jgi:hypothetical protein
VMSSLVAVACKLSGQMSKRTVRLKKAVREAESGEPEVQQIPTAELERMRKIQEVILKAMAGKLEVVGGCSRSSG